MKKNLLLAALFVVMGSVAAFAGPRAIGGRLGSGVEFSYEHGLNSGNMVSLDAGVVGFHGLEVAATHDWIFNISAWDKKGSWNWYAGVGAGVGAYDLFYRNLTNYYYVGVAGRIGAEYNFWFPLQLSLDWRPIVGPHFYNNGSENVVGFNYSGLYQGGFCLGVRYLFP